MLFPLFELQDLERGRVSDSSPSAMQPGVGACEHSELILVSVKFTFPKCPEIRARSRTEFCHVMFKVK